MKFSCPHCFRHDFCAIVFLVALLESAPAWAQFETRATDPFPEGEYSIAMADFNHDKKLDVVVITNNGFSVALGNGDGTFQRPVSYSTKVSYGIAAADFNNDGNQDVVSADLEGTVSVYLGKGDGTFQTEPIVSPTAAYSYFIAVGDFNNDGKPDVVVIDPPYISVLLGNGDGSFGPPNDNDSFSGGEWLAIADFNNDHKIDVLVTGSFGSSYEVGVLLGNGDGTLQNSITESAEYVPAAVAAGDMNGDGNMDAIIGYNLGGIGVFIGNGDGTLRSPVQYATTGLGGGQLVVYDLNLDGKLDVAVPSGSNNSAFAIGGMDVLWGNGDGTLQPAQFFGSGVSGTPVVGDLNGDQLPDFALGTFSEGVISMLNTGAAGFSPTTPVSFPTQVVNTRSATQTVTLTNNGASPLSIGSIKVSGRFGETNACGTSLAAGARCTISPWFQPLTSGSYSGLITIMDGASSKPQYVELSGLATAIKISPTSLNFGAQTVGTKSQPQAVTATNMGSVPISFGSVGVTANQTDFSQTTDCMNGPIQPGAKCTAFVTFDPAKVGNRTAKLYFTLPKGSVSPLPVSLTGTGK